jgi:hypothetical protein
MNRLQSLHCGKNSVFAMVESVVAYPQSSEANQYRANSKAPAREWCLAKAVRTGGFSPGRTLGPVVATLGDVGGLVVGAVEIVAGGGELTATGALGVLLAGLGEGPSEPPLVQPTAPRQISTIGATTRNRTAKSSHELDHRAFGCPQVNRRERHAASDPRVVHKCAQSTSDVVSTMGGIPATLT